MGISVFFVFFDFKIIILISLKMNFFTIQFLGVAMLIVNTFAAPLGEEEREVDCCSPQNDDCCVMLRGEKKRGDTNEMQNGGEGEEERREETVITPEYSPDYTRVMIDSEKPTKAFGICPGDFEEIPPHYEWNIHPKQKCFYLHKDSTGTVSLQTFSEALKICEDKNSTIFDPNSLHEGNRINTWIQNQTDSWPDVDVKSRVDQLPRHGHESITHSNRSITHGLKVYGKSWQPQQNSSRILGSACRRDS